MKRQTGLTLIELLITLAIIAILVGVVFPGFQGILARNNIATTANSMVLAVNLARGEAVTQSGATTLVAIDSAVATNEWGPGWQVLTTATNAPAAPCAAPGCLREFPPVGNNLSLDAPGGQTFVQFDARGAVIGGGQVQLDLLCAAGTGLRITISPVGRPSTQDLGGGPGAC